MSGGHHPDDDRFGPPPPADDRLWRHPSEMTAAAGACATPFGVSGDATTRPRPQFRVVVLAGAAGALVAIGMVVIVGTALRSGHADTLTSTASVAPELPVATSSAVGGRLTGAGADASPLLGSIVSVTFADGHRPGEPRVVTGLVIDERGHAVVADRSLHGARPVGASTPERRTDDVRVVATDDATGLTVLRLGDGPWPMAPSVEPERLTGSQARVVLALRSELRTTDDLWIAGGMVNAVGSSVPGATGRMVHGLLQIDARPLDDRGAVLATPEGHPLGLVLPIGADGRFATAMPFPELRVAAGHLLSEGRIPELWIGVGGSTTRTDDGPGFEIDAVVAGSPAAAAGLRPGDVITRIGGTSVERVDDVAAAVAGAPAGRELPMTVLSGDTRRRITVRPIARPTDAAPADADASDAEPEMAAVAVTTPG